MGRGRSLDHPPFAAGGGEQFCFLAKHGGQLFFNFAKSRLRRSVTVKCPQLRTHADQGEQQSSGMGVFNFTRPCPRSALTSGFVHRVLPTFYVRLFPVNRFSCI